MQLAFTISPAANYRNLKKSGRYQELEILGIPFA